MKEIPRFQKQVNVQQVSSQADTRGYDAQINFANNIQSMINGNIENQTKEALAVNAAMAQSTISNKIMSIHRDSLSFSNDPKVQAQSFNEQSKAYVDKYISGLPAENQPRAMLVANSAIGMGNRKFSLAIDHQNKANAFLQYSDSYKNNSSAMTEAINSGDTKEASYLYASIHNNAKDAVLAGFISEKQSRSDIDAAQKNYVSDGFINHVNQLITKSPDDARKFLAENELKGIKGLSNNDTYSLVSKGYSIINRHIQSAEIKDEAIKKSASNLVTQSLQTGSYDKDKFDSISGHITSEAREQLQEHIDNSISVNSKSSELMTMDQESREKSLDKIKNSDFDKYIEINKLTTQFEAQYNHDKSKFLQDHPAILEANHQENMAQNASNSVGSGQNPESFVSESKYDVMARLQKKMGTSDNDIRLLKNAESSAKVSEIKSLPLADQLEELKGISSKYKNNSPAVWRQLSTDGLPIETQLLVNLPDKSMPHIQTAIDAFNTPINELQKSIETKDISTINVDVDKNLSEVMGTFSHYNSMSISKVNQIKDAVKKIAMGLVAKGEETNASSAAITASNMIIHNVYDTPSYNGHSFRIPKSMLLTNNVDSAAGLYHNFVLNQKVSIPNNFLSELSNDQKYREERYKSERLTGAYFVTSSDSKSVQLVDSKGVRVAGKDGSFFKFNFEDLKDPNSKISKIVSDHKSHYFRDFASKVFSMSNLYNATEKTFDEAL